MTRDEDADVDEWDEDAERREHYREQVVTPFVGEPEDVGAVAAFVASDDARYMTGHNLVVDGGYAAR
jgi:NAD(P)-dependent dehydrogenase (short-subunit alcohol dehydrogenase family)